MKYAKPRQICIRSGIDYNDLENEINRLQIEHRSAGNEHKLAQDKLDKLLQTDGWDEAESKALRVVSKKAALD